MTGSGRGSLLEMNHEPDAVKASLLELPRERRAADSLYARFVGRYACGQFLRRELRRGARTRATRRPAGWSIEPQYTAGESAAFDLRCRVLAVFGDHASCSGRGASRRNRDGSPDVACGPAYAGCALGARSARQCRANPEDWRGTIASTKSISGSKRGRTARKLLKESSYEANARKASEIIAGENAAERACDVIEGALR